MNPTQQVSAMSAILRGLIAGACAPFLVSGITKLLDLGFISITSMESDMRTIIAHLKASLPTVRGSGLARARLRRPTKLPTVVPTTSMGRYLHRLRWLFGGG